MTWAAVLSAVGARGAIGALAGALLVAAPAYHAGRWVESEAAEERLARIIAERDAARTEAQNERIGRALEARRGARGASSDGGYGGGVPDDGFRRD